MKKLLIFFALIGIISFFTGTANAITIILQPGPTEGKDTWIRNTQDPPYGDSPEMRLNDKLSFEQYGLIEFNLSSIPSNSNITSAELSLYCYNTHNDLELNITTYQILASWTENVQWSNQPSINPDIKSSTSVTIADQWYTWDLNSLTQDWINGTIDNYGIMLKGEGDGRFQSFATSDYPTEDFRPYLEIDYYSPVIPEPTTILLLGSGLLGLIGAGFRRRKRTS